MSKLNIKKRNNQGSSSSRRMRSEGILPGIMYGSDNEPNLVEMNLHQVEQILKNHNSDTILIEVDVENEGSTRVLMKEVQYHPVTSSILHVDLQKVVAGKPIQVDISVELKGEPEGVKSGGLLDHITHSISIECLPKDVISSIEVDISNLDIGNSLSISDISVPPEIKILSDENLIIVSVSAPKVNDTVEDEETEDEESSEPEVINEKTEE
ncbi:MAG: 50S ribosomal protein L25 [Verrucomicrobiota bacterium]|nr:50S ribosomal protein L25 [Verrucomicrobiota bacterium]